MLEFLIIDPKMELKYYGAGMFYNNIILNTVAMQIDFLAFFQNEFF